MFINRLLIALLGGALLGNGLAAPGWAIPAEPSERAPIEFHLHSATPSVAGDHDIWTSSEAALILRSQQELAALRPAMAAADLRQPFSEAVSSGLSLLPVVGQFANQDWMKGLVALGTAAGLTTAIVLGQSQNQPDLVRLGTLGLYPLVIMGTLDAYATRQERHRSRSPDLSR